MLNITSISVHGTKKLEFMDDQGGEPDRLTKWLSIGVQCGEHGSGTDGFALFYSKDFTPVEVEEAMMKYLRAKGYVIGHPNNETDQYEDDEQ